MSWKKTNTELFRPCTFLASQVLHRHILSSQLMLKSLPLSFLIPPTVCLSEVGVQRHPIWFSVLILLWQNLHIGIATYLQYAFTKVYLLQKKKKKLQRRTSSKMLPVEHDQWFLFFLDGCLSSHNCLCADSFMSIL